MRSAAGRMEEECWGSAEEESRGVLWKRCPRRGMTIRDRVDD